MDDLVEPRRTYRVRPQRYDRNYLFALPVTPYEYCKRRIKMSWSTNRVECSRQVEENECCNISTINRCQISEKMCRRAVSVEWNGQYAD
jgi:hypothetical protein